ncbi:single-strand binding protein [Salsuginibacillus halophilus]|uniref:Single-stranded DNA-binding protein n=1 Tax=Salsuginibacillus halophilus TaxID=517424 RepID=A0A2P8HI73_9BACI|nr:single-stranded DNA-binding protein [Salsuginibacillus halophilus]PSL45924.1 single-strand binding protein [Salsuginibacillus halophilus]
MINRVVLVGRLTRDPELRYTPNGVAVCNFGIAINRPFTNQQGEREADFFNCVVWRKQAENVANYLKKGSLAGIDGRLQSRSYENNEGRRVNVVEVQGESVQFLETRNSGGGGGQRGDDMYGDPPPSGYSGGGGQGQQGGQNLGNNDPFANQGKPIDISDDDLPF